MYRRVKLRKAATRRNALNGLRSSLCGWVRCLRGSAVGRFPVLETGRLRLRRIVAADAPALLAIHGDPERMRWYGAAPLARLQDAHALVSYFEADRRKPDGGIRWAIERKQQPGLIGTCGFFDVRRARGECSIGFELVAAAQGQGYMEEALRCVIGWSWTGLAARRIEAEVWPQNQRSLALLSRLGFAVEGCKRSVGPAPWHDVLLLSLLRAQWQAAAPSAVQPPA